MPARVVTAHPAGTSTETAPGAVRCGDPCSPVLFPGAVITTGRESLSMPSEDSRQTRLVLLFGSLIAGLKVLKGML